MAGNKSSEGKLTTLECMECGFREVFTERQIKITDGFRCYVCEGLVTPTTTRTGEPIRNRRMKDRGFKSLHGNNEVRLQGADYTSQKDWSTLGVRVNIEVEDALKGLKAIQREAKKATQTLKELEKQQVSINDARMKYSLPPLEGGHVK